MDPMTIMGLIGMAKNASKDIGAGMGPKPVYGQGLQPQEQAGGSMMPDALSGLMQNPEMLKMFGQFGG